MKTLNRLIISLCIGLLMTSHIAAQQKTAESNISEEAIRKAVLETNVKMTQAADALDVDTFFSYILDTDKGLIIQNGTIFKTRLEALQAVKKGFMGLSKIDRRFENPQVTVISPDVALLAAEGTATATLVDGRMIDSGRFAVSLVFVRKDNRWKLLHGHYSMPVKM